MAKASVDRAKMLQTLKARSKGAFKTSKKKEVVVKGSRLPDGLVGAVAVFSSWKLDKDKKGDPYFALTGIGQEPENIVGARVTKMHYMKSSPKVTIAEKWDKLCNDIKLIGGEDCLDECESEDDIPAVLDRLVKEKAAYTFNTWLPPKDKQNPNPSLVIMLQGNLPDYEAPEPEEEIEEEEEEETEEAETEEEEEEEEKPKKKPVKKSAKKPEPEPEEEEEETEEETEEEEEEETEEEAEEGDWKPEKKEIYQYKATPKAKPEECQVIKVDEESETVSLKRMKDSKVFRDVAWAELIAE